MNSNDVICVGDLFPHIEDFEVANKDEKTYKFLDALGLFFQQAILQENEFVEITYNVKQKHNSCVLVLNWDVDLDDREHKITVETSDIDNTDKFIISFKINKRGEDRILSEKGKGGFPLGVLENNEEIYHAFINFLLAGIMPDLWLFEHKTLSFGQQKLFVGYGSQ